MGGLKDSEFVPGRNSQAEGKESGKEVTAIRRTLAFYNSFPNVLWSALTLFPLCVYCYRQISMPLLLLFGGLSFIPAFIPNSMIDRLRFARTASLYKKLGIRYINNLSQNGTIINKHLRKKFPAYMAVSANSRSRRALLGRTYFLEKFHLMFFLFFTGVTFFALLKGHFLWAFLLLLSNIVFNIYPSLLQQYIRLRLGQPSR